MTEFRGYYPTVSLLLFLECLQRFLMEVSKIKLPLNGLTH